MLLLLSGSARAIAQNSTPSTTPPANIGPSRSSTVIAPPSSATAPAWAPRRLSTVAPPSYEAPINGSSSGDARSGRPLLGDIMSEDKTSGQPMFGGRVFNDPNVEYVRPYDVPGYNDWTPQFLPEGLIYRSYLAGAKESRMASIFNFQKNGGTNWDITLGGRVGLFRYGSSNGVRPEGFQVDIEGSAQPRLDLDNNVDLMAVDFRAGLPITYGIGPWQMKVGYYHLSSHAGDEYMVSHPGFQRINYARDVLIFGQSYYLTDALRAYGEVGWAFYDDVSEAWEFQFGADYSPLNPSGFFNSAPFFAINGHLREELNFGGNLVVQAGRQWRGGPGGQLLRIGLQYYNGKSNQFEFYNNFENKIGLGIWYDY